MANSRELSQFGRLVEIKDGTHIGIGTQSDVAIGFGTITAIQVGDSNTVYYGDGSNLSGVSAGAASTAYINAETLNVSGISTFQTLDVNGDIDIEGGHILYASSTNSLDLMDNVTLRFGNSRDLRIGHTGSYSYIRDVGTGNIVIGGDNNVDIYNSGLSEAKAKFITNGAVELYYDAVKKFETATGGITVTGTINGHTIPSGSGTFALTSDLSSYATTSYVDTEVASIVDSAPGTLNTLNELAAALGDDANFSTTVTNSIATKMPLAGGTFTGNVDFNDNVRARFGTSNDLQIYHDGSTSLIKDTGTGLLAITSNGSDIRLMNDAQTENLAIFNVDGAVELYHDGAKKFDTVSGGARIYGYLSMQGSGGHVYLPDSAQLKLGNSEDLKIYHDGSVNRIRSDVLTIIEKNDSEDMASFNPDGAVTLFHNGSSKFETTSSGISVTGNVVVSGTVDGRDVASDGSKLDGIESGATADQSASEILTLLKTVDGAGSGLDADTLDGHSSGAYLRTNLAGTASQNITFNAGGGAATIAGNSDIRFNNGNWTGNAYGKIQQHNNTLYIAGGTNGIIFREDGSDRCKVDHDGHFVPATDDTYDLGTSSLQWRNGYFDGTVNADALDVDGSADIAGNILLSASSPKITFNTGGPEILVNTANNLEFLTSGTHRLKITNSGDVRVKDFNPRIGAAFSSVSTNFSAYFGASGTSNSNLPIIVERYNDNGVSIEFKRSTNVVGNINVTASSTNYVTSSDHRLKENIVDLDGAITRVKQLAPKRFNFIVDADTTVDGFLAHEAATVVPEAVTGTHNEVDDENNPVYQGIDQSKLVPLLTAALQEAIAKIETLETQNADLLARVTALEGS